MRARLQSMSSRSLLLVAGAVVLVYAAAVWMLMVSPKRADAASAKEELAAAESRLELAQAGAQEPRRSKTTPVADVFRLARAMPSSADQPGIVIEISRLARQSGVTLRTLTVQDLVAEAGGPALVPVTVTVTGSYGKITRFLARTRTLVTVRGGKIHTKGRLFVVGSVGLAEAATDGFPKLDATIALDAFVYDGPIVPPDIPAPEEELPAAGTEAAGSTD